MIRNVGVEVEAGASHVRYKYTVSDVVFTRTARVKDKVSTCAARAID